MTIAKTTASKDVAEILEAVSDKIPGMIKGLFNAIYSAEAGAEAGKIRGQFLHKSFGIGHSRRLGAKALQSATCFLFETLFRRRKIMKMRNSNEYRVSGMPNNIALFQTNNLGASDTVYNFNLVHENGYQQTKV